MPVAERILCLISRLSRKTDSARFNIKKGLTLISFHARHCLFNLLLLLAIAPKRDDWVVLRGDDLRLKERVTFRITGGAGPQGKPRPSSCDGDAVRIEAVSIFTIKY